LTKIKWLKQSFLKAWFSYLKFAGSKITEAHEKLDVAMPLDACTGLPNLLLNQSTSYLALVMRGGCSFPEKLRRAQAAGFDLVVVYNSEYGDRVQTGITFHSTTLYLYF
jgi:hypothetical protein